MQAHFERLLHTSEVAQLQIAHAVARVSVQMLCSQCSRTHGMEQLNLQETLLAADFLSTVNGLPVAPLGATARFQKRILLLAQYISYDRNVLDGEYSHQSAVSAEKYADKIPTPETDTCFVDNFSKLA